MNSKVLLYAFVFLPGLIFSRAPFIDAKILDVDEVLEHNYTSNSELKITDEFFGESVIFKDNLEVDAELIDVNLGTLNDIKVIYQGCAEGKYCYPKVIKSI